MVKQFANEAIDILLEWTVQGVIHGLMYTISAFPQADIQYTGMKNANNITIVALCGENSSPPLNIEFSFGEIFLAI